MDFNQNHDEHFYQPNSDKLSSLSIASMTLGILSAIPCCMGTLSIPFGALGILFAVLTRRKGQRMHSLSFMGLWLSCVGLFWGIFVLVQSFIQLPQMLNDPAAMSEVNALYQMIYGMNFEEFLNTYYGIQLN